MDCAIPEAMLAALSDDAVRAWMEHAFYPALLGILAVASLGLPIPEDVPLIAAGVILHTHPGVASWLGTIFVALLGIMSGDVFLYSAGRRWGRDVFKHRSVSWLITPVRLEAMSQRFHRNGTWMCFVGRFFVGIRAVMCITAGVTRFPFWRFFLADLGGALLSIPLFVGLGYAFAGMLPKLRHYMVGVNSGIAVVAALLIAGFVWYEVRKHRRKRMEAALAKELATVRAADAATATPPISSAASAVGTLKPTADEPAVLSGR
ncbi:MAG: DedA family protein [Phycisphaerae bacterium]